MPAPRPVTNDAAERHRNDILLGPLLREFQQEAVFVVWTWHVFLNRSASRSSSSCFDDNIGFAHCRLSLRQSNVAFAERKTTMEKSFFKRAIYSSGQKLRKLLGSQIQLTNSTPLAFLQSSSTPCEQFAFALLQRLKVGERPRRTGHAFNLTLASFVLFRHTQHFFCLRQTFQLQSAIDLSSLPN